MLVHGQSHVVAIYNSTSREKVPSQIGSGCNVHNILVHFFISSGDITLPFLDVDDTSRNLSFDFFITNLVPLSYTEWRMKSESISTLVQYNERRVLEEFLKRSLENHYFKLEKFVWGMH